jgi:hypothetical protein
MNNMKQRTYEFEFTPNQFSDKKLKAELVDNYLDQRTSISVVDPTVVQFSVTPDAQSSASGRFMIVFTADKKSDGPKLTSSMRAYPNPFNGNSINLQLDDLSKGIYQVTLYNNMGQAVTNVEMSHDGGPVNKQVPVSSSIPRGNYQLQLKGGDTKLVIPVVRN